MARELFDEGMKESACITNRLNEEASDEGERV